MLHFHLGRLEIRCNSHRNKGPKKGRRISPTHMTLRSSLKTLLQRRTTFVPPAAGTAPVLRSVMASEQNFLRSRMTRDTTGCSILGGRPSG